MPGRIRMPLDCRGRAAVRTPTSPQLPAAISEVKMNRAQQGKIRGSPADLAAGAEVLAVAAWAGSEAPAAVALEARGAAALGVIAGSAEPISATTAAPANSTAWRRSS